MAAEQGEGHKRRRERSPPPRARATPVDDELARKKRELEELNEMIAFKKSLMDPRGPEPRQRTCIDYDHGRIANPLAELAPVRSILKKRPEDPEYPRRLPPAYDEPYYDRPRPHLRDCYPDGYAGAFAGERPYDSRPYDQVSYQSSSAAGRHYADRYDVYEQPYDDPCHEPTYADRPPRGPYAPEAPSASAPSSLPTTFGPPPPAPPLSKSPSPGRADAKPPLDRFLDMLQKKAVPESRPEPVPANDQRLPHERALEDGKGFSRIAGLAGGSPSGRVGADDENESPPAESKTASYSQIQTLLRTIGLKLSTADVAQLADSASEASSGAREGWEQPRRLQADAIPSHAEAPVRSRGVSEYEEFLDQQELEMLKKARELQDLTKTMASASSTPRPPPGPPPARYRHPSPPLNWPLGISSPLAARGRLPPGPPPGPPPRRPPGQPPFAAPSEHAKPRVAPALRSSGARGTSPSVTAGEERSDISTTVAKCLKVIESAKSLAAATAAKTLKSVQFSLPPESATTSGPAGSPEQVGDVKSRQTEKVECAAAFPRRSFPSLAHVSLVVLQMMIMMMANPQEQQSKDARAHQRQGDGAAIAPGIRDIFTALKMSRQIVSPKTFSRMSVDVACGAEELCPYGGFRQDASAVEERAKLMRSCRSSATCFSAKVEWRQADSCWSLKAFRLEFQYVGASFEADTSHPLVPKDCLSPWEKWLRAR